MTNEITVDIREHISKLSSNYNGWSKELNVVAWNGGVAKLDIREWSPDHERMTRGITLYEEEARILMEGLIKYFGKEATK